MPDTTARTAPRTRQFSFRSSSTTPHGLQLKPWERSQKLGLREVRGPTAPRP
ncbi:hypothetical protein ACWDU3_36295 [Streptomyces olivaceus]